MGASHVDLFNCTKLAEWLEEHDRMPNAAQLARSLRAVMAGFVAATDPTPPPATQAMIEWIRTSNRELSFGPPAGLTKAFFAEWLAPATPPTPEQPPASSPWKCSICGKPVRIGGDLQPWHLDGPTNHDAELSNENRKTLADGLRLTD